MPTINVQISDVKKQKNNISFIASFNNKSIQRTVNLDTFNTWLDFANWLISQEPDFELLPEKEKNIEITFHIETVETETGESTLKVVDNVSVT